MSKGDKDTRTPNYDARGNTWDRIRANKEKAELEAAKKNDDNRSPKKSG